MSLRRVNPKRDGNEPEIIHALQAHGVTVIPLSGRALPDLLCSVHGLLFLVEVKTRHGKLTVDQAKFWKDHVNNQHVPAHICRSVEEIPPILQSVTAWYRRRVRQL